MTIYEVTCICFYEEEADSAEKAKEIVEQNIPHFFNYMIAKKQQRTKGGAR